MIDLVLERKKTLFPRYVAENRLLKLQRTIVLFSFFNLFIVATLGVVLRAFPFFSSFPFEYKNVLHGHSHFAFGGWIMPILLALILKYFPSITNKIAFKHWRNIAVLLFLSAYGMLLSFPVEGYKPVSIFFSTLSIVAGYYLVIVLWKALKNETAVSAKFLRAGLIFLAVSAIGPFATAPLIAMGKTGTPIYYNAIYYYLHFQYNGWFTFAVFAVIYRFLERKGVVINGQVVFNLLVLSCVPAYFLSVLWNRPSIVFNVIGGTAALIQVIALFYFLKDVKKLEWKWKGVGAFFLLAIAAFIIKIILQLISAIPAVAVLAYQQRNITIAYLHLVLLGFISLFAFAAIGTRFNNYGKGFFTGVRIFLFSFILTEMLLVGFAAGNIYNFTIPFYSLQLLLFSSLFPAGVLIIFFSIKKNLRTSSFYLN